MSNVCNVLLLIGFATLYPCFATAAMLSPNSIICDNKEDLETVNDLVKDGMPPANIFKFSEIVIGAKKTILKTSTLIPTSQAEIDKVTLELKKYQDLRTNCAASGPSEQTALVVERKAIAGMVKIRTAIGGNQAEVWTRSESVVGE